MISTCLVLSDGDRLQGIGHEWDLEQELVSLRCTVGGKAGFVNVQTETGWVIVPSDDVESIEIRPS